MTKRYKEEEERYEAEIEILRRRGKGAELTGMAKEACDCGCGTMEHGVYTREGRSTVVLFVGEMEVEMSPAQAIRLSIMLHQFCYAMAKAVLSQDAEGEDDYELTGLRGEA